MNINIGQKVVIKHFVSSDEAYGTYAGSSLVQRYEGEAIEHMAIVKLDNGYSGYLHSDNGKTANTFIQFIVVHPDNLDVVSE